MFWIGLRGFLGHIPLPGIIYPLLVFCNRIFTSRAGRHKAFARAKQSAVLLVHLRQFVSLMDQMNHGSAPVPTYGVILAQSGLERQLPYVFFRETRRLAFPRSLCLVGSSPKSAISVRQAVVAGRSSDRSPQ